MLNSRDISLLRLDVAENCRIFLQLLKLAGYDGLITGTVRDDEYQRWCYDNGYSKAKTPSFHSVKAGLAFDVCKNVKGHEYDDNGFWRVAGEIGKQLGFTWGGDWKSFTDKPHFQWDDHGKYTGNGVRAGNYPGNMPDYEEDAMTGEEIYKKLNEYLDELPCPEWASEELAEAVKAGITDGKRPCGLAPRYQTAIMAYRSTKK